MMHKDEWKERVNLRRKDQLGQEDGSAIRMATWKEVRPALFSSFQTFLTTMIQFTYEVHYVIK